MQTLPPAESHCPRCGAAFGCGVALQRCWCHEVSLSAAAMAELRARYDACLCPACLREWSLADASRGWPAAPSGMRAKEA